MIYSGIANDNVIFLRLRRLSLLYSSQTPSLGQYASAGVTSPDSSEMLDEACKISRVSQLGRVGRDYTIPLEDNLSSICLLI
jgi:hypothetical protein